jgi:hypothetical protein
MGTTVGRNEFINQFANTEIDLASPDPEVMGRLAEAGVTLDDLRSIAGKDGIISGHEEAKDLYYLVEKHDHNGTFKSIEIGAEGSGMSSSTEAGEIYKALMDAVAHGRTSRPDGAPSRPPATPTSAPADGPSVPQSGKSSAPDAPQRKIADQHTGGRTSPAERQHAIDHFKNDLGFKDVNFTPGVMFYTQADKGWRDHPYAKSDGSTEARFLLQSGCAPTALAMVDATLRKTNTSPGKVADYAVDHKVSGKGKAGTNTTGLVEAWAKDTGLVQGRTLSRPAGKGADFPESGLAKIKQNIDEGGMVIIGVDKGDHVDKGHFTEGGHVMVLTGHGVDKDGQEWYFLANPGRSSFTSSKDGAVVVDGSMPYGSGMVRVKKETLLDEMRYAIPMKGPATSEQNNRA